MNRTELLSPGQTPRDLGPGATPAENAGLTYLGNGSEAGAAALEEFRQAGMMGVSEPRLFLKFLPIKGRG